MVTKKRFVSVLTLSAVMVLSAGGAFAGLAKKSASAAETEPDHKVAYYVQGYKGYGADNKVEWTSLPSDIGIKTLPNQYNTNNRFNNSRNDSPQEYQLFPESKTGDYGGDGKLWGLYYFPEIQHDSYGSAVVAETDPLYETPFKSVVSTGSEDWGSNQPIVYKFEMPDTTTEYDVVIGANAYALSASYWGTGERRTNEIFINDSAESAASYENTATCNYAEIHDVKAVEEECVDGVTRNILTITIRAAEGKTGPAVSFVSIADEMSAEPAYLADECTSLNLNVSETRLPETIEVLTTAGMKSVPVEWTDTAAFDNADNHYLLNTVEVSGTVTVSGFRYNVTVPVQFIEDNVYYYMNMSYALANGQPERRLVNQTFEAMKAANADTFLNTQTMYQVSDGNSWGAENPQWITWIGNDCLYNENPYATIAKAPDASVAGADKEFVMNFPGLPAGKYTLYIGTQEPSGWTGRTMSVSINGEKAGDFTTTTAHNDLGAFSFEQTADGQNVRVVLSNPGDVLVGFAAITEYEEPSSEINYGDDTQQMYFLNAGDTSSSRVNGIGRPYYQTSFSRAFNEPNGGEVIKDETGMAWGYYYNQEMAEGYYASAGAGDTPFSSMLYTNIDAADREMIFKFELPDSTASYDIVIGFSNVWSTDNGNNRGANIFVNHGESSSALVTNLGYNKAVVLSGITAEALDPDTGLENILTISLQKPNSQSGSEPTVSFISVRETGKAPVYIPRMEIAAAVELNAAALPTEIGVLTTAGIQSAEVTWTDTAEFEEQDGKYFLGAFTAEGSVSFGGENFALKADFIYVDTAGVYYYIDTTIVDENGNTYLAPLAQAAFDAMAGNGMLLNEKADGKSADGSWGNTNVNDIAYYNGYSANPYLSVVESTEAEAGLYYLMYNFPELPAGDYLVQVGVQDPWGPRPSDVLINGESVGTLNTVTGADTMMSFMFSQPTAGRAVSLDMAGVNGQLAGFIVIRSIDTAGDAESISISTNAYNYFFELGTPIDLTGLTILVDMGNYTYVRTVTQDMISGYDADQPGVQTITITCAGQTVSYDVTVYEPEDEEDTSGGQGSVKGCGSAASGIGIALTGICGAVFALRRRKK